MKLWVLGSGSKGNALVLESGGSRLLVDGGFGPRILATRMRSAGIAPESIEAVIVTHEHWDHVRGVPSLAKRWGWSVHATAGTIAAFPLLASVGARVIPRAGTFTLGGFDLQTVPTSHDAEESIAIVATSRDSGARVGMATDLGRATSAVRKALMDLDLLVIESNHDDDMLAYGPYPPMLKRRIASDRGHLSNIEAARVAGDCVSGTLKQIVLAHLSESNNTPSAALAAVRPVLRKTRFQGRVYPAPQHTVIGPIEPVRPAVQLGLGL